MLVDLVIREADEKLRQGEIDAAYRLCHDALEAGATSAALFAKRGQLNRLMFRNAQAIEDLTRAVNTAPSVNSMNRLVQALETVVNLAEALKEAGEYFRAIELLETYLRSPGDDIKLYVVANGAFELGRLRRQIWQSDRAWRCLRALGSVGSPYFDAEIESARREIAKIKTGITESLKKIRKDGETPDDLRRLAEHLCRYGKPRLALACLERMSGGCEHDAQALIVKFYAMLRLRSVGDAVADLMKHEDRHKDNGDYAYCLAFGLLQLGAVDAAVGRLSALPLTALQGRCFDLLWRIQVNKRGAANAVLDLACGSAADRENSTAASQYLTALHLSGVLAVDFGAMPPSEPRKADRPKTILQFWDRDPPDEIVSLTAEWRQSNPDWTHRLFNDEAARAFIRSTFGSEWTDLYDFCHHPAMKSDVFRIGYLLVHGGIYLDADEKCLQPADAFFKGWEGASFAAVTSRDAPFYIHNWFLAAAPGHAILNLAWELMTASLRQQRRQSRKGDIWQTTGPGLLTRAVAQYRRQTGNAAIDANMALITEHRFRQFAQTATLSYKATKVGNWRLA